MFKNSFQFCIGCQRGSGFSGTIGRSVLFACDEWGLTGDGCPKLGFCDADKCAPLVLCTPDPEIS